MPMNPDYMPIGVISLIIVIALAGVFFLYPAKKSDKPSNPTSKVKIK